MYFYLTFTITIIIIWVARRLYLWINHKKQKNVWYNINLLFKAYNKACQNLKIEKRGIHEFAIYGGNEPIYGVDISEGLCHALNYMNHMDYELKHDTLNILSQEMTLEDLEWIRTLNPTATTSDLEVTLESIRAGHNSGIYWFYRGDVLSRRALLSKVLRKYGKLK